MGEIDTKPIESVQSAISLFGERSDQRSIRLTSKDEMEKEKEYERLVKDLASVKIQLEAKDSAYKQALFQLDYYQSTVDELSTMLQSSELEKIIYVTECMEAKFQAAQLESKVKELAEQLCESVRIREQLSLVISELRETYRQIQSLETELSGARDAKLEAMRQAENMETSLGMEKVRTEELIQQMSELSENLLNFKLIALENDKENSKAMSEKEAELHLAEAAANEAHHQLECARKQLEIMQYMENQLLDNSAVINSLQLELQEANTLHQSSEKMASDAINEVDQLRSSLELMERKNLDKDCYISVLETQLTQMKSQHRNAIVEVECLNLRIDEMGKELEKVRNDLNEISAKENDAQVEIAMMKSELHKGRSKLAAAEIAEERAKSEKSALNQALQELALELEEAKKENKRLLEEGQVFVDSESTPFPNTENDNSIPTEESQMDEEGKEDLWEVEDLTDDCYITITREEYEALINRPEKAIQVMQQVDHTKEELELMKKELEVATSRIEEFRMRAEQAISRAEAAEKGKAELEDKIRRWKEYKEKKRAALSALRDESISREINSFRYDDNAPKVYQPLGKVLNMKF